MRSSEMYASRSSFEANSLKVKLPTFLVACEMKLFWGRYSFLVMFAIADELMPYCSLMSWPIRSNSSSLMKAVAAP